MKKLFTICAALFILLMCCKKDKEIISDIPFSPSSGRAYTIDDFTKFDTGNYWLYKNYRINSTGETAFPDYDSCFYMGDTILGSSLYKRVRLYYPVPYMVSYLKDSSGYLFNGNYPILSIAITNDTFFVNIDSANGFSDFYIVTTLLQPFTVPAGTFSDVLEITTYHYWHLPTSSPVNPLVAHFYYAKDVGKISEQYYFSGELFSHPEIVYERRLIGYHVN